MKKTQEMQNLIAICSNEELEEIAKQWCDLVGEEPKSSTLNAFMMGAKIAISNNGWIRKKPKTDMDDTNDCGDANEY